MSFEDRVDAVEIATQFQEKGGEVIKIVEEDMDMAKTQIILAREYLKDVSISRDQVKYLVMEALRGGCQVELVILPRSSINETPPLDQQNQQPPPPPPPQNQDAREEQIEEEEEQEDENDEEKDEENEQEQQPQIPEEFIFDAEGGLVDEKLLFFAQQAQRRKGKLGERRMLSFLRIEGDILSQCFRSGPVRRLAVDATLRADAPYQKLRTEKDVLKTRKVFV
ncbi:hypothetical protein OROMI_012746 [Orobanche minor]